MRCNSSTDTAHINATSKRNHKTANAKTAAAAPDRNTCTDGYESAGSPSVNARVSGGTMGPGTVKLNTISASASSQSSLF